jgi:hypothetical protein
VKTSAEERVQHVGQFVYAPVQRVLDAVEAGLVLGRPAVACSVT